jgi:hypothetical protein
VRRSEPDHCQSNHAGRQGKRRQGEGQKKVGEKEIGKGGSTFQTTGPEKWGRSSFHTNRVSQRATSRFLSGSSDWSGPEDVITLCPMYLAELRSIVAEGVAKGFLTP